MNCFLGRLQTLMLNFVAAIIFLGIDVYWHIAVGDNRNRILEALKSASKRSDIIITTGGLGPTMDDISKETVAEFLGMGLEIHEPSLKRIEQYFKSTGRIMTENNKKQAMFPKEAKVLQNDVGTAPGAIIEKDNKTYIVLPGPPAEMQHMFINYVLPHLADKSDKKSFQEYCMFSVLENPL